MQYITCNCMMPMDCSGPSDGHEGKHAAADKARHSGLLWVVVSSSFMGTFASCFILSSPHHGPATALLRVLWRVVWVWCLPGHVVKPDKFCEKSFLVLEILLRRTGTTWGPCSETGTTWGPCTDRGGRIVYTWTVGKPDRCCCCARSCPAWPLLLSP